MTGWEGEQLLRPLGFQRCAAALRPCADEAGSTPVCAVRCGCPACAAVPSVCLFLCARPVRGCVHLRVARGRWSLPTRVQIALVLIPRKVHVIDTAVWSVFTSLPQPLMAVLAFHFTSQVC
jgi:hypothetical protein